MERRQELVTFLEKFGQSVPPEDQFPVTVGDAFTLIQRGSNKNFTLFLTSRGVLDFSMQTQRCKLVYCVDDAETLLSLAALGFTYGFKIREINREKRVSYPSSIDTVKTAKEDLEKLGSPLAEKIKVPEIKKGGLQK